MSPPRRPSSAWPHRLWLIAAALFVLWFFLLPATQPKPSTTLSFTAFLQDVAAHKVKTITIDKNGNAAGTLNDATNYTTTIPPQAGESFLSNLESAGVQISAKKSGTSFGSTVLWWVILLLPFLIFGSLWWRLSKGATGGIQQAFGVRPKAQDFDEERPSTTFAAGYEGAKAEIREVVDFLQRPDPYATAGAMAPRASSCSDHLAPARPSSPAP